MIFINVLRTFVQHSTFVILIKIDKLCENLSHEKIYLLIKGLYHLEKILYEIL